MAPWLPLLLALVSGPLHLAEGLSSGAPNTTCSTMLPRHRGSVPQSSAAPYVVTPSARQVARNGKMTVVLSSPQGLPIHGFMMQARVPGTSEGAQGVFSGVPDTAKTINCDGIYASAVTHKDASKKNSLTFEWTAPNEDIKSIIFNATVVEDFQTYWTGVVSEEVQVVDHSEVTTDHSSGISTTRDPVKSTTEIPTLPPAKSVPRISDPTNPIYTGCGSTKACFGPNDCIDSGNCNIMVSVRVEDPLYEFEMFADGSAYVAVGLSGDNTMGDDSVVECTYNTTGNNGVEAFLSYNLPNQKRNQRETTQQGIAILNGSYADGVIYCKFTRDAVTVVQNQTYDLRNTPYYLLLVSGSSATAEGIGYHTVNTERTSSANYLSDVSGWTAASKVLLRLHGAFMVAAWIGTTSLGIVLARYFKQTWVGTQMCNKDLWFAWHRMLMLLTWTLTIAGFIIICIELKDWSQESNPHATLGTITTLLAFIQPIGAAFRPHPGSKRRPIFNWMHWLAGNVAHILAIITIFFSVKLGKAELPEWMDWILVAYVAFYVITHLVLSVAGCVGDRQSSSRIDTFPMKDIASSRLPLQDRKQDAPLSLLRKILLGVYVAVILGLTIAIIVIVSLAPIEDSVEDLQRWLSGS